MSNKKPLAPRGERPISRGATLLGCQIKQTTISLQVQLKHIYAIPWALITVPSPAKPTWDNPFGLQLPSPFSPCASTGSHLTRLSELRFGTY